MPAGTGRIVEPVLTGAFEEDNAMTQRTKVGLFVTCLVDLHRPNVGFSAVKLLEQAGCEVVVPGTQTCCGQPAWNSGDKVSAQTLARQTIDAFADVEAVVVPSGSCAGMLRVHYPKLLAEDSDYAARAESLAARTYELMSFLVDELPDGLSNKNIEAVFAGTVTYHDGCSGLRELGIRDQPRKLLQQVEGLTIREMEDTDVCCGFGGTFCVKFPDISERMVSDKVALATETGADALVGGDLGCLLNISGRLSRLGLPMQVWHVAEVLADKTDIPAIAQAEPKS
ncbi:MAG: (Fe-S)-binding protein [Granulosicoccus sp.]